MSQTNKAVEMQISVVTGEDTKVPVFLSSCENPAISFASHEEQGALRHLRTQKPSPYFLSSLLPPRASPPDSKGAVPSALRQSRGAKSPARPAAPPAGLGAEHRARPDTPGRGGQPGLRRCPALPSLRQQRRELQLMLRGAREYACAPGPRTSTGCARGEETKPCPSLEESAVSAGTHPRAGQSGRARVAPPAPLPSRRCLSRDAGAAPEVPVPTCRCLSRSGGAGAAPEVEVPVPPQRPCRRGERSCPRSAPPLRPARPPIGWEGLICMPEPRPQPGSAGRCPAPGAARRGESPPRGCREAWAR